MIRNVYLSIWLLLTIMIAGGAQAVSIVSTSTTRNAVNASQMTDIAVVFDEDMDPVTIDETTFIVHTATTGSISSPDC